MSEKISLKEDGNFGSVLHIEHNSKLQKPSLNFGLNFKYFSADVDITELQNSH